MSSGKIMQKRDVCTFFDRYASFTDLHALKEASEKPLRRSLRVNTLKTSVEQFKEWAKEKQWSLDPVPWCPEGFFISRVENEEAFGRDLLHQLGHTYIQEAASMLPVELLDPKPGEMILDLCAAPGSKTTQIAARMGLDSDLGSDRSIHGVIIANDTQEKRLWILKQALHRSGVTNSIVTKKEGEWFGKHMTERFDRVLVDAPCSAQGILRKDPGAAAFSHPKKIEKFASIQRRLLEAGIHATKIGGRIVYSTCTLTPEENELLVAEMLEKFAGKVEAVDPTKLNIDNGELKIALEDTLKVQKSLQSHSPFSLLNYPCLRLWPQTYDTEGFFCAILQKTAPTREVLPMETVPFQERRLRETEVREIHVHLEEQFGTSFLEEGDCLFERGDMLLLTNEDSSNIALPILDYSLGLPFTKRISVGAIRESLLRIRHDLVTLRGNRALKHVKLLTEEEFALLLQGKDLMYEEDLRGDVILRYRDLSIGLGRAEGGILRNRIDRTLLQQLQ